MIWGSQRKAFVSLLMTPAAAFCRTRSSFTWTDSNLNLRGDRIHRFGWIFGKNSKRPLTPPETPGVTHFGAYHRSPDGHIYFFPKLHKWSHQPKEPSNSWSSNVFKISSSWCVFKRCLPLSSSLLVCGDMRFLPRYGTPPPDTVLWGRYIWNIIGIWMWHRYPSLSGPLICSGLDLFSGRDSFSDLDPYFGQDTYSGLDPFSEPGFLPGYVFWSGIVADLLRSCILVLGPSEPFEWFSPPYIMPNGTYERIFFCLRYPAFKGCIHSAHHSYKNSCQS